MQNENEPSTLYIAGNLLQAAIALGVAFVGMLWFLIKWFMADLGSAAPIGIFTVIAYLFTAPKWLLSKDASKYMEQAGNELVRRIEKNKN